MRFTHWGLPSRPSSLWPGLPLAPPSSLRTVGARPAAGWGPLGKSSSAPKPQPGVKNVGWLEARDTALHVLGWAAGRQEAAMTSHRQQRQAASV